MKNISKEAMIALTIGESFSLSNHNSGMYGKHGRSINGVGSNTDRSKVKKSRKANKKRRSKKK